MDKQLNLRPEVAAFAQLMEAKLRENDHKGGWKNEPTGYLSRRLGHELSELRRARLDWEAVASRFPLDGTRSAELATIVALEAADVANFAMMLADVCGALR